MQQNIPTFTLNDGLVVPAIAFGTYKLNGRAGVEAMVRAVDTGYRWFDSAFNYENEGALGRAVRTCGLEREALLVSSKLPGRHHEYDAALVTIEESLFRAGLDYYDLYYIHWPNPKRGRYVEAWRALIEAKRRGWVRSVAVCNFLPDHLDTLTAETGVTPSVNQIELHPYFPQPEQRAYDRDHGILTQAWSPLGRAGALLEDEQVAAIARKHGRSIPQIVLRWEVQLGVVPIPKATSPERQNENLALFDFALDEDDVAAIARLARPDGRLKDQDPARYEEF